MRTVTLTAPTERDTENIAAKLAKHLFPGAFIALRGGLGAGKTAFTRGLGEAMGIHDVMSPTFTIVQVHRGEGLPLFHFDAYRLGCSDELYDIGFDDYVAEQGIIVMEWPSNVEDALPDDRLEISITGNGDQPREIVLTACGEKHAAVLERL